MRSIRDADVWPSEIEGSLRAASVIIVVIGTKWLTTSDDFGRRRIDLPGDWVRRELELGFAEKKKIFPLLIDGTTFPKAEALPPSIASLAEIQARKISDQFDKELVEITIEISRIIKRDTIQRPVQFPIPGSLFIEALDENNLKRALDRLPEWHIDEWHADNKDKKGLSRNYVFESFDDAIHFMNTASRFIDSTDHHPEWTNIWRTVIVRLTTFDIGFKPTMLDVDLASYLDDLYKSYQRKISKQDVMSKSQPAANGDTT
jgi:pterin-4a-carbinolamine dehydratase